MADSYSECVDEPSDTCRVYKSLRSSFPIPGGPTTTVRGIVSLDDLNEHFGRGVFVFRYTTENSKVSVINSTCVPFLGLSPNSEGLVKTGKNIDTVGLLVTRYMVFGLRQVYRSRLGSR